MERMRYEVAMELGIDGIESGYLGDMSCVQCGRFGRLLYARANQILKSQAQPQPAAPKNQRKLPEVPKNQRNDLGRSSSSSRSHAPQGSTRRRSGCPESDVRVSFSSL
jgi:hypothetical protein